MSEQDAMALALTRVRDDLRREIEAAKREAATATPYRGDW
jgi:hypothetical protein